jgi:hypothetical protein
MLVFLWNQPGALNNAAHISSPLKSIFHTWMENSWSHLWTRQSQQVS